MLFTQLQRHGFRFFFCFALFMQIGIAHGAADKVDDCQPAKSIVRNRDGSHLKLKYSSCDQESRDFTVSYQAPHSHKWRDIFYHKNNDEEVDAFHGAYWIDLAHDGFYDLELRGRCGAGPNCEGKIYKLKPDRSGMYLYFIGGYSSLKVISGWLVEDGKDGAGTWVYELYSPNAKHYPITIADRKYRVIVGLGASDMEDDEKGTPCLFQKFIKGKGVLARPPNHNLIKLCQLYEGKFYLVSKLPKLLE